MQMDGTLECENLRGLQYMKHIGKIEVNVYIYILCMGRLVLGDHDAHKVCLANPHPTNNGGNEVWEQHLANQRGAQAQDDLASMDELKI